MNAAAGWLRALVMCGLAVCAAGFAAAPRGLVGAAARPLRAPLCVRMQERGGNRDKIFPKGRESVERAKELDKANRGDEPSLIMREKKFEWPAPFGFLNTLKEDVSASEVSRVASRRLDA